MPKTKTPTSTFLAPLFAKNLAHERERAKLSMAEVAERTGLVKSYVSMLENGQRSPSLDVVERVAKSFGKDPRYFFR